MHPPTSIVPPLCKHNKKSLDPLYDIMLRVQSSIMVLTNIMSSLTSHINEIIMPILLCTIIQTFLYFSALCLKGHDMQNHSHDYNNTWLLH